LGIVISDKSRGPVRPAAEAELVLLCLLLLLPPKLLLLPLFQMLLESAFEFWAFCYGLQFGFVFGVEDFDLFPHPGQFFLAQFQGGQKIGVIHIVQKAIRTFKIPRTLCCWLAFAFDYNLPPQRNVCRSLLGGIQQEVPNVFGDCGA
jgi:hypothetical protein